MIKVLHIASFKGNVGDIVNHKGFYNILKELLGDIEIEQLELRRFYRSAENPLKFNYDFAQKVNEYDALILGGGGFFDVRWDYSNNSTTLDFSIDFIETINIPVLVNAMGYHEYPGVTTDEQCQKFAKFMNKISSKNNWLLTVRNDGSYERLKNRYQDHPFMKRIIKVADNGFWCNIKNVTGLKNNEKRIGFCITNDLFSDEYNKQLSTDVFNREISLLLKKLIEGGNEIVLFPHIPSDLQIIQTILQYIPDAYKRESIIVAPYVAGCNNSPELLAAFYSMCSLIVGMRFHSCILAIQQNIPCIALAGHVQIESLFKDLNLSDMCIVANTENIGNLLFDKIVTTMSEQGTQITNVYSVLNNYLNVYKKNILEKFEK